MRAAKFAANTSRRHDLKQMLVDRRRGLVNEVQSTIRGARTNNTRDHAVLDEGESSEADIQGEIEFALIQMKAETLNKIETALRRLEEGTYGGCSECGDEIAEPRLRALPFALRCKDCEEAREWAERHDRFRAQRRGPSAPFFEMSAVDAESQ
jgi:DnaK suppressor protein